MSLAKKSLSGVTWNLFGKTVKYGSQLFISIYLARLLTPEMYGLVGMVMVIIGSLNILLEPGISQYLIQRSEISKKEFDTLFTINLLASFFLFGLFNLCSSNIAKFYGYPELNEIIHWLSILILVYGLSIVHTTELKKDLRFKELSITSFSSSILGGVAGIIAALFNWGIYSLVIQILLTSISSYLLKRYFSNLNPSIFFERKYGFKMVKESSRYFYSSLLLRLNDRLDIFLIGKYSPAFVLGLYSKSKGYKNLIFQNTSSTINSILFPLLSKIKGDEKRYLSYLEHAFETIVVSSALMVGFLLIISNFLFLNLLGSQWVDAIPIFNIICLSSFFYSVSRIYFNVIRSTGSTKLLFKCSVLEILLQVIVFGIWIRASLDFSYLLTLLLLASFISFLNYFYFANTIIKWKMTFQIKILIRDVSFATTVFLLSKQIEISSESLLIAISFFFLSSLVYIYMFKNKTLRAMKGIIMSRG